MVLGGFGVFKEVLGVCGWVQRGSTLPLYGTLCPSGSLVGHQIWLQTLHNGPTSQLAE